MKKILFVLFGLFCSSLFAQQAAQLDEGFFYASNGVNSSTGGTDVKSLVTSSDGKVLIGGYFNTVYGVARNNIARLNSDGKVDNTFNIGSGFDGRVETIAIQADGKILVGGLFSHFNGTAISGLARLTSTGGFDPTFSPVSLAEVDQILVLPDGKILVRGPNFIYRLTSTGAMDNTFTSISSLSPQFSIISSLRLASGKILVSESPAGTSLKRYNSDGTPDNTFITGTGNGTIYCMVEQSDAKVVIGGGFLTYNGVGRSYIARINADGTLDATYNPGSGVDKSVRCMIRQSNNQVFISGYELSSYNGSPINLVARINTNGTLDTFFPTQVFGSGQGGLTGVTAMALRANESLIVGGDRFSAYGGTTRENLAVLTNNGTGMIADGNQLIQNGCTPSPVTFSSTPVSGATFQWFSQAGVVTRPPVANNTTGWTQITGATSATFTPGPLSSSISYACRVTINGKTNWAYGLRSVYVFPIDSKGTLAAGDQTLASPADPAPITFSILPTYSVSSSYQWYYKAGLVAQPTGNSTSGWVPISGATGHSFDPSAGLTSSRTFACFLTYNPGGGSCPTLGWATGVRKITVTGSGVTNSPGTLASGNQTLCNGGDPASVDFSTGATGTSLSYQWYYQNGIISSPTGTSVTGWTVITGAISTSYDPPSGLTQSRTYACFVKAGTTAVGWASNARQVTVTPPFNPGTVASGDQTLCVNGNPANITLSVLPSGALSGQYAYRWYYKESVVSCPSGTSATTGWIQSSSTQNSYDPQSAGNGRTFALRVSPVGADCFAATWANGCRKIFVSAAPCNNSRMAVDGEERTVDNELLPALYGSAPNPFETSTFVSCFIPEHVKDAQLLIYQLDGRIVQEVPISAYGMQSIEISADHLSPGIYIGALSVSGNIVARQRVLKK